MATKPVETKAVAGPTTAIIAGYLAWAVIQFVPGVKDNLPVELQQQLPFVLGSALAAVAAYRAPHTHRPDLPSVAAPAVSQEQVSDAVAAYLAARPPGTAAALGERGVGSSP